MMMMMMMILLKNLGRFVTPPHRPRMTFPTRGLEFADSISGCCAVVVVNVTPVHRHVHGALSPLR